MTSLGDCAQRGADNYLPLRLLAACGVLFGHCYALTMPYNDNDFIARLLPGFYGGSLAVFFFFAISGYLVTLSLIRQPGLWRYVRNRLLRVFPAYWVCLLVCALILGPIFTTLPLSDYFRDPGTWHYIGGNILPASFVWVLPGVFKHNPYPDVVNGSIWSLGLEVRWYVYLGVLTALTLVQRRWAFTLVVAALLLHGAWATWAGPPDDKSFRALSLIFVAAGLCAQWRDRVPVSHLLMAALVASAALLRNTGMFFALVTVAVLYASFWIAYALPALPWPKGRDYSYGVFLYAFPVQQAIAALWPGITPLAMFAIAAPTVLLLAMASWHGLEAPALRLKNWPRKSAAQGQS